MCMRLRGLLFSALVIAVAANDGSHAGGYPSPGSPYAAVVSRSPATAAPPADDAGPGPLKIPDAALEPVGWDDLDGWAHDDHASAFAAFYASCRPIVRAYAFRAESRHRSLRRLFEAIGLQRQTRDVTPDPLEYAARRRPDELANRVPPSISGSTWPCRQSGRRVTSDSPKADKAAQIQLLR
jgi:hypothetical protein